MKKVIFFAVSGLALMGAQYATAADGTITISGQIVDVGCDISVNGGNSDSTVVLPTVSKNALANPGDIAGSTAVNISLNSCPESGGVRAYFEALNVDQSTGHLLNTAAGTPAGNVQVKVTDAAGTGIDLRTNTTNNFVNFIDGGSGTGTAELQYGVQYVSTGTATAGRVETQLTYSLEYN
ncbi:MAG: fimbrial protein [Aeromonas sobria]